MTRQCAVACVCDAFNTRCDVRGWARVRVQVLLRSVEPEMVLSGDDHDHCSIRHHFFPHPPARQDPSSPPASEDASHRKQEFWWTEAPVRLLAGLRGVSDLGHIAGVWSGGRSAGGDEGAGGVEGARERGRQGVGERVAVEHTVGTVSMLQVVCVYECLYACMCECL